MKAKINRISLAAIVLILVMAVMLTPYDPPKMTMPEIRLRVDILNESAAVTTPHMSLGKDIRKANISLFEKVERGVLLSRDESAAYRVLYQKILKENQSRLSLFDGDLTVINDVEMRSKNNVGGHGIQGSHDHHDASSNKNFSELQRCLLLVTQSDGITGGLTRIGAATCAYKNLTDIILHMGTAPHTKSVGYRLRDSNDNLERQYESMMVHYKRAQFMQVNSPAYVSEIHLALQNYDALVTMVQDDIFEHLSPLERTLSGRWSSWKSLSPFLDGMTADRMPR